MHPLFQLPVRGAKALLEWVLGFKGAALCVRFAKFVAVLLLVACERLVLLAVEARRLICRMSNSLGEIILSEDTVSEIQVWLHNESNLAYRLLTGYYSDECDRVYENIRKAKNCRTQKVELDRLADDPSWIVRTWVAVNPNTDSVTLHHLAQDKNARVRACVPRNKNTSPSTLACLAGDASSCVRWEVAMSRNAPADLLGSMVDDCSYQVRASVACNPSATKDKVLPVLARDRNCEVRKDVAFGIRDSDSNLFGGLAADTCKCVRAKVGRNPFTPPALLSRLARDKAFDVRLAVAKNPFTPPATLDVLAQCPDRRYRDFFVHVWNELLAPSLNSWQVAGHHVRWHVARHPKATADTLALLARDKNYCVRGAVAENGNTPAEVLVPLAEDAVGDVRECAEFALDQI